MHRRTLFPVLILFTALLVSACNAVESKTNSLAQNSNSAPAPEKKTYPDGVRRITIAELETLMKEGEAFVVDVRSKDSYEAGHIPGARLIPSGEILNHLKELPRDKTIVTYCS